MFKLIFIDIDGTLLTSVHKISKGTLSAIQRIREINNIHVILTTARPPQGIEKLYAQLNLNSPAVCFNGALILDRDDKDNFFPLMASAVHADFLSIVYKTALKHHINTSFYKMWEWLSDSYDTWIRQEEDITDTKAVITNTHLQIQKWAKEKDGPNKILLMGEPGKIDAIETILKKITNDALSIYKSKPTYLEIMNGAASKRSAIHFLLDRYGLTTKDVLAIGDNYNDIEMLKLAGLGIAMGNSPDEVKANADFITLDNDSEGIQFALDKFVK